MTPVADPLDAVATAIAEFTEIRRSGAMADPFQWRERLGDSHSEFLELLEVEATLEEVLEPPTSERLPREFGAYRLLRELGRGAYGVVYEAEHRASGRRAAVKILKHGFDGEPKARERMGRAVTACAKVRHDHVVEIYDSGEVEGRPIYAMEIVSGRSLGSLISTGETPAPRELARELARVADALHAFHQVGIVHRDVKPSNLMVRDDGRILLADFDLVSADTGLTLTASGEVVGTLPYMSPEQVRQEALDGRADVYSLGATIYEALAGRRAFPQLSLAPMANAVLHLEPEDVRKVRPDAPDGLARIAMKALAKRKDDRYADAAQLRDMLQLFADGRRVPGGPVSPRVLWFRSHRRQMAAAAAMLLVLGAAIFWWTHRPARLDITSIPSGATVLHEEVEIGRTPLRIEVRPGVQHLRLHRPNFEDRRIEKEAGANQVVEVFELLDPTTDAGDAELDTELKGRRRIVRPSSERSRGPRDVALELLSPRGAVSLGDARVFTYAMPKMSLFQDGGVVRFRRGDEVLGQVANFSPPSLQGEWPVPLDVLGSLRVGDAITMEWEPPAGSPKGARPALATFRVVDPIDRAAYDRLVARVRGLSDDRDLELEAGWLRAQGRGLEAARLADRVADAHPTSLRAQAVAFSAYADLGLADSARAAELSDRISAFPAAEQDRVLKNAIDLEDLPTASGKPSEGR